MKKLIVASVMLLGAFTTKAQSIQIIPKAGINIATQSIEGVSNEKMKVGFQGGVGVNLQIARSNFSIQPEINYVSKGVALKAGGSKNNLNLGYLELPVLAKYSFGPVYINAGPSIGLLVSKEEKVIKNYGSEFKKIDVGALLGAGVALPAGPGKVIIDARYQLGLNNISEAGDVKNRGIMASVGYAISL